MEAPQRTPKLPVNDLNPPYTVNCKSFVMENVLHFCGLIGNCKSFTVIDMATQHYRAPEHAIANVFQ